MNDMVFVAGMAALLGVVVIVVVAVGQGGRHTDRSPRFTEFAREAVGRLNGELPSNKQDEVDGEG